uniref:Ribosomal protein uS12 methylthiotransferase RimO n=1 Tax=candidate division WOR-3 bacterium TaxID=2052148 RepID=A0A7C4XC16_UNCW3
MIKVHLISLGCPKNLVDSEKILGSIGASGVAITPSAPKSDIIIINTCGFIRPAVKETEDVIKKTIQQCRNKKIYVYGCGVNRMKENLKSKFPEINNWFKLEEKDQLIKSITNSNKKNSRLVSTCGYAYLKIADGCSNRCSYCTIPSIKGEHKSFDMEELIKESLELAKLGIREIILIAQDTTRYGIDLYHKPILVPLVREISKLKGIEWIRIMYAHPKGIDDELIGEMERNKKICKYLDLPIQHINNRILNLMNRGYNRKDVEEIIKKLKKIKNFTLRTSVIVGFPTEQDKEFDELCDFLKTGYFDWVGVFPFYCEPETEAGKLPQLPKEVIKARYKRVTKIQKSLICSKNRIRVGSIYKTLIHTHNGLFWGHTEFSAPAIDGQVIVKNQKLTPGNFYNLKMIKTKGTDLYA